MIGISNKDTSFFKVFSPDIDLDETDMSRDLISLTITERLGAMPQGSLQFYDKNHIYSRILRTGAQLKLTWGYGEFNYTEGIVDSDLNLDEITGNVERRGYAGFISSPGGAGASSGVITYDCNFTAYGFRGEDKSLPYTSGTRADVVIQAFTDIGILPINMIIDFTQGTEKLSTARSVRQDETTFAFLTRIAKEWRALFSVSFNQQGLPVGIFIDHSKVAKSEILQKTLNAKGANHFIGFKGEISNVKSYTWKSNESESGVGHNVQMEIIDGQPIFRRYVAEQETVITYKLNTDRIKAAFDEKETDGIVAQTKLMTELLSAKNFEEIAHFFDPYESTTAPQGFGYKININMNGNPLYSPPNIVSLANGFPDRLGNKQTIYYLNKVTHTINRSGYSMSCEVVDAFTFSDIGVALI